MRSAPMVVLLLASAAASAQPPTAAEVANGDRLRVSGFASTEFGLGAVVPNLRVPMFHLGGRVGVTIERGTDLGVFAGGLALDAAFNTSNSSASTAPYGYLVRLPLSISAEWIKRHEVDPFIGRTILHHLGAGLSCDFVVAATCLDSTKLCSYYAARPYFGLLARVGVSYAVRARDAIGIFLIAHLTTGGDQVLFTFNLAAGWTSF